jgi:hypothetical protein
VSVHDSLELLTDTLDRDGQARQHPDLFSRTTAICWEHRWVGKNTPYDGTTRVPFLLAV